MDPYNFTDPVLPMKKTNSEPEFDPRNLPRRVSDPHHSRFDSGFTLEKRTFENPSIFGSLGDLFENVPRRLSGMSLEEGQPMIDDDRLKRLREQALAQEQEARNQVRQFYGEHEGDQVTEDQELVQEDQQGGLSIEISAKHFEETQDAGYEVTEGHAYAVTAYPVLSEVVDETQAGHQPQYLSENLFGVGNSFPHQQYRPHHHHHHQQQPQGISPEVLFETPPEIAITFPSQEDSHVPPQNGMRPVLSAVRHSATSPQRDSFFAFGTIDNMLLPHSPPPNSAMNGTLHHQPIRFGGGKRRESATPIDHRSMKISRASTDDSTFSDTPASSNYPTPHFHMPPIFAPTSPLGSPSQSSPISSKAFSSIHVGSKGPFAPSTGDGLSTDEQDSLLENIRNQVATLQQRHWTPTQPQVQPVFPHERRTLHLKSSAVHESPVIFANRPSSSGTRTEPGSKPSDKEPSDDSEEEESFEGVPDRPRATQTAEERRQVHILSEQKRRANINEGFESLRNAISLPTAQKASKSKLLQISSSYIAKLKETRQSLIEELNEARMIYADTFQKKEELKRKVVYSIGL